MKPDLRLPNPNPSSSNAGRGFEKVILRLVKGGPERVAIEAGQIDAIIDSATGKVILLPEAQRALVERKARFRSLVALCSDWTWEQDEHYRFAARAGAGVGSSGFDDAHIIGKTLWELPFDNMSEADWQTHRTQLEWRATFRGPRSQARGSRRSALPASAASRYSTIGTVQRITRSRGTSPSASRRSRVQEPNRRPRHPMRSPPMSACSMWPGSPWRIRHGVLAASHAGIGACLEGANYLADATAGGNERGRIAIAGGIRQVIAESASFFATITLVTPVERAGVTSRALPEHRGARSQKARGHHRAQARELLLLEHTVPLACRRRRRNAALKAVICAVCETQGWDCG
jgi:PAS domain-containing protein